MQDNKRLADALYEQVTLNKDVSLRTFKNYLDIRKHLRREQCVDYSYRYFNLNFDNSHYLYALAFKEDKLLTKGHLKFLVDKKTVLLSTDLDFKDEYGSFLDSHSQDKKFCRASALSSETTSILNSDTYYVQDIHFLLSKVYKINLSVRTSMGSFIDVYVEN